MRALPPVSPCAVIVAAGPAEVDAAGSAPLPDRGCEWCPRSGAMTAPAPGVRLSSSAARFTAASATDLPWEGAPTVAPAEKTRGAVAAAAADAVPSGLSCGVLPVVAASTRGLDPSKLSPPWSNAAAAAAAGVAPNAALGAAAAGRRDAAPPHRPSEEPTPPPLNTSKAPQPLLGSSSS